MEDLAALQGHRADLPMVQSRAVGMAIPLLQDPLADRTWLQGLAVDRPWLQGLVVDLPPPLLIEHTVTLQLLRDFEMGPQRLATDLQGPSLHDLAADLPLLRVRAVSFLSLWEPIAGQCSVQNPTAANHERPDVTGQVCWRRRHTF